MKIVVITHNYIRRRGDLTALYLHRLSAGLAALGLDLVVVCPHAPGLLHEETIDAVRIVRFDYPFSRRAPIVYGGSMHQEVMGSWWGKVVFAGFLWSFYRAAKGVCRREQPDLLWANWWIPPGLVAARLAAGFGIPLIVSSHGTDIALLKKRGLIQRLSRFVYRRTARATVVSTFLKETLLKYVDAITAEQVAVVPMPIGMETFPRSDPPANAVVVLLSVARFTHQKRLEDIIAAAARLADEDISFRVVMVGEGPLETELKEMVGRLKLTDRFTFIPLVAQQRLGELYRQSDAVVLASEGEGFGLVLVEAGMTGRPVVAARSGGITDIVEHDVNGLLFEPGDIDGLTRCLRTIIAGAEIRNRMGQAGYAMAMERFATPVLIGRIHDLFVSLKPAGKEIPK